MGLLPSFINAHLKKIKKYNIIYIENERKEEFFMSSPYNALTENDKTNIFEYLLWNSHHCGADEPYDRESKKVLSYWDKAKENLFELFDHNLILSKKVTIPFVKEVAEEEFYHNSTIQNFLSHIRRLSTFYATDSYKDWYWLSSAQKEEMSSVNWLSESKLFQIRCSDYDERSWYVENLLMNTIFDAQGILNQTIEWQDYQINSNICYIPYTESEAIKVTKGEKTMRVIGKLVRNCFPSLTEEYERFRIAVSRLFNTSGLSGDLCLSIHPLDYMTMSDNEANWSSCMSWEDEGEYRCGTVEMMNSESVVVGYLKSENTVMEKGNAHWNSKKWRSLFIVTEGAIVSVKGYPYASDVLTKECLTWLKELYDNCPVYNGHVLPEDVMTLDDSCISKFRTNYMYNDFGTTTHYGYVSGDFCKERYDTFLYSGVLNCMSCGEPWDIDGYDARTRNVNCQDCNPTDEEDEDEDYDQTWDDYTGEYINTEDGVVVGIFASSKEEAEHVLNTHGYIPDTVIGHAYVTTASYNIDHVRVASVENGDITHRYYLGTLDVEHTFNGNMGGYYIFLKDQNYSKMDSVDMDFLRCIFTASTLDSIIEESKKAMVECSCS